MAATRVAGERARAARAASKGAASKGAASKGAASKGAASDREPGTHVREAASVDACPGVLRLHAAADGQLARVRAPGGRLDARALEALGEAAALGSDLVELTSRAGLQVRGLSQDSAGALADVLARGGLLPSLAHDRVRNILAAPLAGRSPAALADVDPVIDALDRALCADLVLAELPGRFLFAVDDGTRVLETPRADVELVAEHGGSVRAEPGVGPGAEPGVAPGAEPGVAPGVEPGVAPGAERGEAFRLYLDGLATSLAVTPAQAPEAALRAARAFLELRREHRDGAWRVRELDGGARRLARDLGLEVLEVPHATGASAGDASEAGRRGASAANERLGVHVQRDGLFAVTVLPPLARLGGAQLARLAARSRALGSGVRVSPWRTLSFVDVPAFAVGELLDDLQDLDLVTSDTSGWAGLSACAGLGACARALVDVRAAAAERAAVRDANSPIEHWSGCERRCGEPSGAGARMVAHEHGLSVSVDGDAQTVATTSAALELLARTGAPA
jgi:sulfite reductase beta subunit-like hemoprotein